MDRTYMSDERKSFISEHWAHQSLRLPFLSWLLSTNNLLTQVDALKYDVLDLSEVLLTEREETAVRLEECLDVSCAIVVAQ